jgi:hypothetical protein
MWAEYIENLSPLQHEVSNEIPKFLKRAFHDEEIMGDADITVPIRLIAALGKCQTALYRTCPNIPTWHLQNSEYSDETIGPAIPNSTIPPATDN